MTQAYSNPRDDLAEAASLLYPILWPERRMVTAAQLIVWAQDDIANGLYCEPNSRVETVADAIAVLTETGSVTLGRGYA